MRVSIGRSWTRNASAIVARRASASSSRYAIGSSETLPLVITSARADVGEQQVVQRRVRQHHPELGQPGRHRRGDRRARRAGARPRSGAPASSAARRSNAPISISSPAASRPRRHQRERLVLAVLARAQRGDGGLVVGAAGEVVAADPLDGEDRPAAQQRGGRVDEIGGRRPARSPRRRGRAAPATGRTPGRRSAGRGSGGRLGRRTRPGSARTCGTPAIVVSGRS